ncbi:deoxyribodipyrimidine photo-lyase [Mycoplasma sp. Mirounga ES2805-ORL]|uniref:cryptochrome/photolyase family protein n=1 Tax=Mycoplasma sp. Mirounga ES2805-ORL TaxID=754514 RepID=UPI00197C9A6A|nr:deoxyribodipyrimidine photo-lyase [Mycoplasma sp. Mirounga ES2805-ORL]QSF13813.1 deoxyribodipyrimidine photo-lyase [Mycoplasma sp. Mirounga ES2805-ORL]
MNILWIRNDLRLRDNKSLHNCILDSISSNEKIMIVFIIDPYLIKVNSFSNDYFFIALNYFKNNLSKKGINIYFMYGEPLNQFEILVNKYPDIKKVYFNLSERGYGLKRDNQIIKFLKNKNIKIRPSYDKHLHSANEIKKKDGSYYCVFTPYFNSWLKKEKPASLPWPDIKKELFINEFNYDESLKQVNNVFKNIKHTFTSDVGEDKALLQLDKFILNGITNYDKYRDIPELNLTSNLSKYLTTGEISIKTIYNRISSLPNSQGKNEFIKELAWRDFYNMIYHFNPNIYKEAFQSKYRDLEWQKNEDFLRKWKEGKTGFPIIDAAMTQLNNTGFMHNRLRMVVASFLTKDLLINWQEGEKYFANKLIDYDSASNINNWQWASSVGTDACPYFRIFNPLSQSKKFDPSGNFIKEFLPNLKDIPSKYIHCPFEYKDVLKEKYGIEIEKIYWKPIVNHKDQRIKALNLFKEK